MKTFFLILFFVITSLGVADDIVWDYPAQTLDSDVSFLDHAFDSEDTMGSAAIAWVVSAQNAVFAANFDPQTLTWTPASLISLFSAAPNAIIEYSNIKLAMDPSSGHAIVIMLQTVNFTSSSLLYAYYDGVAWTMAVGIPGAATPQTPSDPALDFVNGTAVAVWIENGVTMRSSFFDEGTLSWSVTPITIETGGGIAGIATPQVALDETSGTAISVYSVTTGGFFRVHAAEFAGVSWGLFPPLSANTADAMTPQVMIDPVHQRAASVWSFQDTPQLIQGSTYVLGSAGWSAATAVSSTGASVVQPNININRLNGLGFTAWSRDGVVETRPFDGSTGTWENPITALSTSGFAGRPSISLNEENGHALIVWQQDANSLASYFDGTTWQPPSSPPLEVDTGAPLGDLFPGDLGLVTFVARNGASFDLRYIIGQVPSGPLPPSDLSGRQGFNRFPTETDYINFLSWVASPTPGVTYRIRRNGVVIAETTNTFYADHHQQPGVPTTYTVTAVVDGMESSAITIVVS